MANPFHTPMHKSSSLQKSSNSEMKMLITSQTSHAFGTKSRLKPLPDITAKIEQTTSLKTGWSSPESPTIEKQKGGKDKSKGPPEVRGLWCPSGHLGASPMRPASVPLPPSSNEKGIVLAVKLPDGSRFQRHFHPSAKLLHVWMAAAKENPQSNLMNMKPIFKTSDIPMVEFQDLNKTLAECQIFDKSLLHMDVFQ
jgi:hypothetical protein